jgi:hypothetical protein
MEHHPRRHHAAEQSHAPHSGDAAHVKFLHPLSAVRGKAAVEVAQTHQDQAYQGGNYERGKEDMHVRFLGWETKI